MILFETLMFQDYSNYDALNMKSQNSVMEKVVSEVVGEDVLPLVNELKNKKNISEFKIAEAIKEEVNTIRNMLYRLYDANLVTFVRKKDKVKGWYIYYWTFNNKRIKYLLEDLKKKRLENLKERVKREKTDNFFICKNKCIRLDFDQATEFDYKCPECGELMYQEDNSAKVEEIKKEITKLEKETKQKNG